MWESAGWVNWCVVVGEGGGGVLQLMHCERARGQWSNRMVLLEGCSNFLKIHNRQRVILLQKDLLRRGPHSHLLRVSVSPASGHLTFSLAPLFLSAAHSHLLAHLLRETRSACDAFRDFLAYVRHLARPLPAAPPPSQAEQLAKLTTLMRRFGTHLAFTGSDEVENDFAESERRERESKRRLVSLQVAVGEGRSLGLFLEAEEGLRGVGEEELEFKFLEKEEIRFKIKMPGLSKCRNVYENNAILNYIKINNPQLLRQALKPANQGGFSRIYSLDVEYWYVYSGSNNEVIAHSQEQRFSRDNMLRKLMVVKRDLPAHSKLRQRVAHEKEILKKIKNGNALFLPKYYIATDDCEVKDDLLADYIFQPSLVDFVFLTRLSLSLNSKVYMLFMLTQGLRYLSLYSIVHLDIKPANLMISRTMLIKIIDFGESYHPEVCAAGTSAPTQTTRPASPCPTPPPKATSPPDTSTRRTTSSPSASSPTNSSTATTPSFSPTTPRAARSTGTPTTPTTGSTTLRNSSTTATSTSSPSSSSSSPAASTPTLPPGPTSTGSASLSASALITTTFDHSPFPPTPTPSSPHALLPHRTTHLHPHTPKQLHP